MTRPDGEAARPWLALARADLRVADMIIERADATAEMRGLGCFHGQQAAEKALKGLLTAWDMPAPRSHDLTVVGEAVSAIVPLPPEVRDACEGLADYAVGPRYPLPGQSVSLEVAARAVRDGTLVVSWCSGQVGLDGRQG